MELKRVVVTGLGAVTPLGNNAEDTWNNLVAGVSGAAPITLFDASQFKTQFACEVKGLKVNDYIDRKEARKMDRYAQLAMISAMQAVQDSGMDLETEDKNRIGVIFGVGIGGIKTFEEEVGYWAQHQENGPKFNPFFIPKMISDIAAGQISIHFGFHGPNYATTSACASSTHAVADAFNLVHRLKVESRVLDTLNGANHGQLRVAVHLAHLLAVQVIADIEVFHLAGELRLEVRRIKLCNRCCAAFTSHEVLPGLLRRVTDWSNGTQTCYYYSL